MKFKTLYYYRAGEKKKAVKSREKLANRQPSISTTSLIFLSSMSKPKTQSMHSFRQIPSTFIPNKQPIAFLVVFFIEVFIFCASWMKMMMKNTCCQLANNKHYSPQALPAWNMFSHHTKFHNIHIKSLINAHVMDNKKFTGSSKASVIWE